MNPKHKEYLMTGAFAALVFWNLVLTIFTVGHNYQLFVCNNKIEQLESASDFNGKSNVANTFEIAKLRKESDFYNKLLRMLLNDAKDRVKE